MAWKIQIVYAHIGSSPTSVFPETEYQTVEDAEKAADEILLLGFRGWCKQDEWTRVRVIVPYQHVMSITIYDTSDLRGLTLEEAKQVREQDNRRVEQWKEKHDRETRGRSDAD